MTLMTNKSVGTIRCAECANPSFFMVVVDGDIAGLCVACGQMVPLDTLNRPWLPPEETKHARTPKPKRAVARQRARKG